ncbi:MAG: hypothetical protein LBI71_06835 [Enterobacteriaceae bacterium]|jgi:hypothetical protein|nr:hypothetical protein [Enterobacteriaceae bacterium]
MTEYPEDVPELFISFHESKLAIRHKPSDTTLSIKEISNKFIFDERLKGILKPLSKRFNESGDCDKQSLKLFSLFTSIQDGISGPSNWNAMTPKEQEGKINKIKSLINSLSDEIKETPYDVYVMELIFGRQTDNPIESMNVAANLIVKCSDAEFINENSVTEMEMQMRPIARRMLITKASDLLTNFYNYKDNKTKENKIIKRKTNIARLYFIRTLNDYFMMNFKTPLYNITAEITSCFLNESITIDSVRSALKK